MNPINARRTWAAATIIGTLVIAGCPGVETPATSTSARPGRSGSPGPTPTPPPAQSATQLASAAPSTSASVLGGRTETGGTSPSPTPSREPPVVTSLLVFPESIEINLPATDASKSIGLPSTATFGALALFSDGTSTDSVAWSASNAVVSVSQSGVVTAVAKGTAIITATCLSTPSATATASVTVTDSGVLGLTLN